MASPGAKDTLELIMLLDQHIQCKALCALEAHVSFLKSCDELPVFDFLLDLLHVADSSWVLAYCCSVR